MFLYTEKGYDDCLLGSQIDGYYRYEHLGGNREELDKAATKIQATFRGHKARQEAQTLLKTETYENKEEDEEVPLATAENFGGKEYGGKEHAAATCIQAGYRGYNTRKQFMARNEAATTIQAGYRGYSVRKGLEDKSVSKELPENSQDVSRNEEEQAAAIKIQSAFRGHRTRDSIREEKKSQVPADQGEVDAAAEEGSAVDELKSLEQKEANLTPEDGYAANEKIVEQQIANDEEKDEAATKIQSNYRGYYTRKQLRGKNEAATTIQAHYRGYRARELKRARSEAAVKIQSYYRGYKTREGLKKRHSTKTFLEVSNDDEFALHRDSRTSFSLPEGVKFEGSLDEDSDAEIDKMVDKLTAIKEATSPDIAEDKDDS